MKITKGNNNPCYSPPLVKNHYLIMLFIILNNVLFSTYIFSLSITDYSYAHLIFIQMTFYKIVCQQIAIFWWAILVFRDPSVSLNHFIYSELFPIVCTMVFAINILVPLHPGVKVLSCRVGSLAFVRDDQIDTGRLGMKTQRGSHRTRRGSLALDRIQIK